MFEDGIVRNIFNFILFFCVLYFDKFMTRACAKKALDIFFLMTGEFHSS